MNGSSLDVDVLVVGGGPAGSACANRLARGGLQVAVIEATDFLSFRIGELIAASVRPFLSQLGIDPDHISDRMMPCSGIAAAWGSPIAEKLPSLFNPYGRAWCVDRRAFDQMLFERARAVGARAFTQCRLAAAKRHGGEWVFKLDSPDAPREGRSRWIIAATGRSARPPLAASQSRLWLDRLIGLSMVDEGAPSGPSSRIRAPLIEATPCGWWYSVSVPNGRRVMIFFTESDLLPKGKRQRGDFLRRELCSSPLTRAACPFGEEMIAQYRWIGFDARSSICQTIMSPGWGAVGDAAMAFDPLSGYGVCQALQSAVEVADWLLAGSPMEQDDLPAWVGRMARHFDDYRMARIRTYGREVRWPDSEFWQRRHQASSSPL